MLDHQDILHAFYAPRFTLKNSVGQLSVDAMVAEKYVFTENIEILPLLTTFM